MCTIMLPKRKLYKICQILHMTMSVCIVFRGVPQVQEPPVWRLVGTSDCTREVRTHTEQPTFPTRVMTDLLPGITRYKRGVFYT